MSNTPRQIECTIPILPVSHLQAAIVFYTDILGFKADWGCHDGSSIASVSRDGCCLMLSQTGPGAPRSRVWIGLENESLFQDFRKAGVKVHQEPRNFSWAYEMKFEDPDGNILWLGTEPRKDLPFEDADV